MKKQKMENTKNLFIGFQEYSFKAYKHLAINKITESVCCGYTGIQIQEFVQYNSS